MARVDLTLGDALPQAINNHFEFFDARLLVRLQKLHVALEDDAALGCLERVSHLDFEIPLLLDRILKNDLCVIELLLVRNALYHELDVGYLSLIRVQ